MFKTRASDVGAEKSCFSIFTGDKPRRNFLFSLTRAATESLG